MNDLALFEEVVQLSKNNIPFALATVVDGSGSSPRKPGAKMLVRSDRSIRGTIGGGTAEQEVIDAALDSISDGKPQTISLVLTEKYGHVCGGKVIVFIEPLGLACRLVIFGAGHVGQALCRAAKFAGFRVVLSDERSGYATKERLPDADDIVIGKSERVLPALQVTPNDYIVIATPDHEGDFAAVRAALKTQAGFIGMIGSRRKRAVLMKTLAEEGFTGADIDRVISPVGLAIGAESPEEIAVSIVAQLIQKRSESGINAASDSPGRRKVVEDGNRQAASSGS